MFQLRIHLLAAAFLVVACAPRAAHALATRDEDTDGDGIANVVEDRNRDGVVDVGETDPHNTDSDGDGLTDGLEDVNANGRVDPGETSGTHADSDGDGIHDGVEVFIGGTDPMRRDSDGDGISDGREDRNRDGILDPGESSPVVSDVFSGQHDAEHGIPEPLVFDLVRGLGARRGEFEVNALMQVRRTARGDKWILHWAPELEVAVADHVAVELELPMVDRHLESVKVAGQFTLGGLENRRAFHGFQAIAEFLLDEQGVDARGLYIVSLQPHRRLGLTGMAGAQVVTARAGQSVDGGVLLNANLSVMASPWFALGCEGNLAHRLRDGPELRVTPQALVKVNHHLKVQAGLGIALARAEPVQLVPTTRVIAEF